MDGTAATVWNYLVVSFYSIPIHRTCDLSICLRPPWSLHTRSEWSLLGSICAKDCLFHHYATITLPLSELQCNTKESSTLNDPSNLPWGSCTEIFHHCYNVVGQCQQHEYTRHLSQHCSTTIGISLDWGEHFCILLRHTLKCELYSLHCNHFLSQPGTLHRHSAWTPLHGMLRCRTWKEKKKFFGC